MIAREQVFLPAIAMEVLHGLRKQPKALPPWLFYDAQGSALFEQITSLPEYYLTRTERKILEDNAEDICRRAGTNLTVVELGAGTAEKTRILLRQLMRRQMRVVYLPVDISRAALEAADERLRREFPRLIVEPVVADYTAEQLALGNGSKLVLYLGSSIGNFEPHQAAMLLSRVRTGLMPGDSLLLGTDRAKPAAILVPAYNDAAGVTERFNKNMLARINRELGGHFDLDSFRHVAEWNAGESRIEIYLESTREQTIAIDMLGIAVPFAKGERIHTENSYKYTDIAVHEMLAHSGFCVERTYSDERGWFSLHLARAG